jgi:hypothetical protein
VDKRQVTPKEMISIIPEDQRKEAEAFILLGKELNCRAQTRYAASNKYWRCVFSLRKPSRVLFTLECTDEWWRIKAVLSKMTAYVHKLDACTDELLDNIKTAYDCRRCNTYCKGAIPFTYQGTKYVKCIGCSYYFRDLSKQSWEALKMLIREDAAALISQFPE